MSPVRFEDDGNGRVPSLGLKVRPDVAQRDAAISLAQSLRRRGLHGQDLVDRLMADFPGTVSVEAAEVTSPRVRYQRPQPTRRQNLAYWWQGVSIDAKAGLGCVLLALVCVVVILWS